MSEPLDLIPGELTLPVLRRVAGGAVKVNLDPPAYERIAAAKDAVDHIVESGETVYAVNTGFGLLANKKVPLDKLEVLQENLVLSHATGTGDNLPDSVVRLVLVTKICALAQGFSGVREEVVDALIALVNADVLPCIPAKGSVGASGDLAPLAHMTALLLGHGSARIKGKEVDAKTALKTAGLEPLKLGPKEGLALLNGTQVSCALALVALFTIEDVFSAAMVAGAMSVEACKGSSVPFDADIHRVRGQKGQIDTAAIYRELLKNSGIMDSHSDCGKVQDPYSLRCQPQVMGACLDHMRFAAEILLREANAVTDNPLVFPDGGKAVSGGNFHAEYVAMAADVLALVIAETGALSERRIAMLIDSNISGLPPFLVADAGVNSGFMIAHVTAAALASENKQKSHPACVDSLPTSANQEDHVSMATHGAYRLLDMAENTATIVGIELLAAAQGMDFHEGLKSSKVLEEARALIRNVVDHWDEDRLFAPDIAAAKTLVAEGAFYPLINARLVTPGE